MDTEKIKDIANRISEIRKFILKAFSSKEGAKVFAYNTFNQYLMLSKSQAENFKRDLIAEIERLEDELRKLTCTKQ